MQAARTPTAVAAALAIAGVVMLPGCEGPRTSATYQSPQSQGFAQDAMARGPLLVTIQGRPYAAEQASEQATLSAMQSAMTWTATPRLTTDPAQAAVPSMRVVMTFNGGIVDANVQCLGGSEGGGPQPEGAVQVTASFCGSGDLISNTSGRIVRSTGPEDPQFASLVRQVIYDLFPSPWQQPQPGIGIGIGGVGGSIGVGSGIGVGVGF